MIYMLESVVNAHDWSSVAKAGYGLWVAKYADYDLDYNYDMTNAALNQTFITDRSMRCGNLHLVGV